MKIKATFLGSLVSHGFTVGQEYLLQLADPSQTRLQVFEVSHLAYPFQKVSYSRLVELLQCWGNVSPYEG